METTDHTSMELSKDTTGGSSANGAFMQQLQKAAIKANMPDKSNHTADTADHISSWQPENTTGKILPQQTDSNAGNIAVQPSDIIAENASTEQYDGTPWNMQAPRSDGAAENVFFVQTDSTTEDASSGQSENTTTEALSGLSGHATEAAPSGQSGHTTEAAPSGQSGHTTETAPSGQSEHTTETAPSGQSDGTPEDPSPGQPDEKTDSFFANIKNIKKLLNKKVAGYIAAGAAAVLLLTYLGVSFFFQKHFLFHTVINGQDFSCQTIEDARTFFTEQADAYTLEMIESGGKTERIQGEEISMTWDDNLKLDYILDKQNAFAWPLEFFKDKSEEIIFKISCDETALSKKVDSLDAVTKEPIPPQSAYPKFDGNAFVIEPEVYGTALDADKLKEKVLESVLELEETMDLQEEGFYEKPKYTTESDEMQQVCKKLNDYCRTSVTYEMDVPVVVDKALISTWLSVDENLNVTLDEAAVRNWILEFDARYDTLGSTRTLTTPAGRETEVSGGTYGWTINEDEEFAVLLNSIRNGEVLTRTISYGQTAASHAPQDWGNTFLEVDLTTQHMWYLKDGAVAFESDVVTGSTPSGMGTPAGVYTILEKLSPTILVGNIVPETGKPEYRTPVDFWMRVTYSGIGFHDATWQPAFGGDVYLWNGSHGCINMPYYNAQALYSMIEVGLPVVIHY